MTYWPITSAPISGSPDFGGGFATAVARSWAINVEALPAHEAHCVPLVMAAPHLAQVTGHCTQKTCHHFFFFGPGAVGSAGAGSLGGGSGGRVDGPPPPPPLGGLGGGFFGGFQPCFAASSRARASSLSPLAGSTMRTKFA